MKKEKETRKGNGAKKFNPRKDGDRVVNSIFVGNREGEGIIYWYRGWGWDLREGHFLPTDLFNDFF